MIESNTTLRMLLGLDEGPGLTGTEAALAASKQIPALKQKLPAQMKLLRWSSVTGAIAAKVPALLDIKVLDVLIPAWKKYRLVAKYADQSRYSPDEIILAPLATHTLKSEHHPYVEILVGEKSIGKISFDVVLSLELKGFVLKIQDARIKSIEAGSCQGEGTVGIEKEVLYKKQLDPFTLPGAISLGEGINIRELAAAHSAR
jgi:hypothetical protein